MDECAGFETQLTSVMQTLLRTAVGEATKVFQQTLHRLKAELMHLRQENVDLKSRRVADAGDAGSSASCARRDVGVQCEKPTMVEGCCSPAPISDQLNLQHITSERLEHLCSSSSEDRDRQLALLLIKKEPQEAESDDYAPGYFLLKQEGAEPVLFHKKPFKNTMEKVLIPLTMQRVSRGYGSQKDIATSIASSPKTSASCNFRMSRSSKTESVSRVSECSAAQSDTNEQKKPALAKKSALTRRPPESTQPLSLVSVSAPTVLPVNLGQISKPTVHQAAPSGLINEPLQESTHLGIPSSQQAIQHSATETQFGPRPFMPPLHPNQNPETCPSDHLLQTMVTTTDERFTDSKSVTSPECSTQSANPSASKTVTPAQNITQLGSFPQGPFPPDQHTGQVSSSLSQILPNQVPVQPIQMLNPAAHASSEVLGQSDDTVPPNPPSLTQQNHRHTAPHHGMTPSTQAFYPLTHASFAPTFNPLSPMKSSVVPNPISQTCANPSLEHDYSHYDMLSDPLCPSSDHFFPSPDGNTSDLLQPVPSMLFHSSVALNQPETNSISSGQHLKLAPLLTLKEQQAAASSHVNVPKRQCNMPVEILRSTVNNFEEHVRRYPPLVSHGYSREGESATTEIHNDNPTENNEGGRPAVIPAPIQHYTVLSKPGPNFMVADSTKEQRNMVMGLQTDIGSNKQKEHCDITCQVWEASNMIGVLPQSVFNAPAQNILLKPARKVMGKKTGCLECGRILSNASSLESHMRLHRGERPYICSQCGKAFPSVRGLNRHVKVHAEEKGYKCEECGRSFVYQFTLTKHKLIHSGDRPFPCKVCGKAFLAKADRATHMRVHTGEKPFFCSQCGKSFKHRVALNMHMRGHRGEKQYVCPHCDKGFLDLGNFKRHKRIHTGEKPFECKACGKCFTQSAHLKKHVKTQHAAAKLK